MSYIWFWVNWLPEHASTFAKYQFTKFGWLTARDSSDVAKKVFAVTLSNSKVNFKKKLGRTAKQRKTVQMSFIWYWMYWLAGHPTKYSKYEFIKVGRMTPTDPKEEAKIILKFLFVTRKRVFRKKQRTIPKEDKKRKTKKVLYLILDVLVARACPNIC